MSDDDGDWDANEGGGDGGDDGADGDFDGGKKKKSPKKPKKADAKKKEPKAKKEPKEKKAAASKRKSAGDGATSPAVPDPKRQKVEGAPPGAMAAAKAPAAASAAAAQGEPLSAGKAKPFLLQYVTNANRPYGYLQVWENTHRRVPKASVTRILDELVQEQKLVSKAFNKNVLYMAVQDPNLVIDEKANEAMDAQIAALTEQVAAERAVVTDIESKAAQLSGAPTDAEADAIIARLEKENAAQSERLRKLKGGHAEAFTQAQVDQVNRDFYNAFMKWKKFKKAVEGEMLSIWMDGAAKSKKPKKMLEDVGIETDEEVGAKMAAFEEMFSKIPAPGKGGKAANGAKASPAAAAAAAAANGVSSPPLPIANGKPPAAAAAAAAAAVDDDGDGHANGGDGDESRAEMDAGDGGGAADPGDEAPAPSGDADEPVAVDD